MCTVICINKHSHKHHVLSFIDTHTMYTDFPLYPDHLSPDNMYTDSPLYPDTHNMYTDSPLYPDTHNMYTDFPLYPDHLSLDPTSPR